METTFKRFLIGYIAAGRTYDDSAMEELENLTNEFINWMDPHYCFTSNATSAYCEFLYERMSEENKHWFPLRFDKDRYVNLLEKWIRHLLEAHGLVVVFLLVHKCESTITYLTSQYTITPKLKKVLKYEETMDKT